MTKKKILVAMSGGVDSSVAAAVCQKEGYEVIGATWRLKHPDPSFAKFLTCTSENNEAFQLPKRGRIYGWYFCEVYWHLSSVINNTKAW